MDGKIKLKSGPQIEKFTEGGIKFDDGTELEADVVIFATGYVYLPLSCLFLSFLKNCLVC